MATLQGLKAASDAESKVFFDYLVCEEAPLRVIGTDNQPPGDIRGLYNDTAMHLENRSVTLRWRRSAGTHARQSNKSTVIYSQRIGLLLLALAVCTRVVEQKERQLSRIHSIQSF